jgi:hypothetical protein
MDKCFLLFKAEHDVYADPKGTRAVLEFLNKYFGLPR